MCILNFCPCKEFGAYYDIWAYVAIFHIRNNNAYISGPRKDGDHNHHYCGAYKHRLWNIRTNIVSQVQVS